MKIVACTKAVPGYITNPKVSDKKDVVEYTAGSIIINESDDYALETGIALKKKAGGEVTVFTVGSLASQKVLQTALAKGAQKALRIDATTMDASKTAALLAKAIEDVGFDLILTGVESGDSMSAQVGMRIAQILDIPCAYAVTEVTAGADGQSVELVKETGAGLTQKETIRLPALLCIQTGTTPTSFVPFKKMMLAQKKPVKSIPLGELAWDASADEQLAADIVKVFTPVDTHQAEMITGSVPEIATQVLAKIKEVV